ncbi:serine hydrolase [Sediminibacter sp. Hel_I_10]|uniref:serine hydrolase domain-containing protein n=1 Tax=Sediminibacter sp. Hel_I_10 TaxID=1392490 RepID=UPI0018CC35FC|nr:serine hydrolase domain-containing protein [Sediminibacter sp. Hel_I_10]
MKQSLIFTILLLSFLANSQNFDQELVNKLDLQIEQYVEGISPGMAVGIVKDGEIVYQKYIGYSNLENQIEINETTSFNIASNAKQFTALCVLRLIEQGKINLEDDFRKFLPDLYTNIEDKITISNLLTHTSGIRDVYDLWALKGQTWWQLFIDNSDAIELLQTQTDLNFKPGTKYLYSNSNYILLTEIIENITDKTFSEFSKALFLELKMPNTSFLTNYMEVIPNKARPYGNWEGWKEYPVITEVNGDGALFTTLNDQLNWEKRIQRVDDNILSKKLINQSQSPIEKINFKNYGYGLMFGTYRGLDYSYHDGSTGAYNATFLRFPPQNISILVISNNGNVPTNYLAKQLSDITLNLETDNTIYPAVPVKIERLKDLGNIVGNYKNDDGKIIKITEKDGSIFREIYQRDPIKLINEKNGLFHYETNEELKMNFTNIKKGQQKLTIYLSSQEPNTYYKLPFNDLDKSDKRIINGRYFNDETDTEILIKFLDNNTFLITKNGRERKAELILKDYLRMNSYEINIIRDAKGNVSGLNVKNGRIENVIFNKT